MWNREFQVAEEADGDALSAAVRQGIRTADPPDIGPREWQPVTLGLHASDGALVGGVYGATMWRWLMIDGLWVAEELRGRGLGRRLLEAAEATAVQRGCRGSWLATFDFQVRDFYEHYGYSVFGEL